jgi:hypothetical protein
MVSSTDDLTNKFNLKSPRPAVGVVDVDKMGREIKTAEDYRIGTRMIDGKLTKLRGGKVIESDVDGSAAKREQDQKRDGLKSNEEFASQGRKREIERKAKDFKL